MGTDNCVRNKNRLILSMDLVKLPQLTDYWSTDELYNLKFSRKSMTRNHTLYKINLLVQQLVKNYKSLYTPDEYVCVDEILLPL